jgi:hypothetical protein
MYFTQEVSGLLEELNHSRAATAITDNTKKTGITTERQLSLTIQVEVTQVIKPWQS